MSPMSEDEADQRLKAMLLNSSVPPWREPDAIDAALWKMRADWERERRREEIREWSIEDELEGEKRID